MRVSKESGGENVKRPLLRNLKLVINEISKAGTLTRAQLSDITGLSLITITNIVRYLERSGIVREYESVKSRPDSTVGRPPRTIGFSEDIAFLIIDLSNYNFYAEIRGADMTRRVSASHTYLKSEAYDENLTCFLESVRCRADEASAQLKIAGVCLTVPGEYSKTTDTVLSPSVHELYGVKIKELTESVIKRNVNFIIKSPNAAAMSRINEIENARTHTVIYIHIGQSVESAVCCGGTFLKGENGLASDFGKTINAVGETLDSRLERCASDVDFAAELSVLIYNLTVIFDPYVIIIESRFVREPRIMVGKIKELLRNVYHLESERVPDISVEAERDFSRVAEGIVAFLRKNLLEGYIKRKK
ncbi:MAG: winged helix-turn-helix domain-containing protein [Firmicutes bacterium]|nr:winged helix-turn-helix domain-containing protein [Bacillota bacterium]